MSASQFVASLTVDGVSFFFARAITQSGKVPDVAVLSQEELLDNGIDGVRYRDVYAQFPEFALDSLEDYADELAGLNLERAYRTAVGGAGTLLHTRTTQLGIFRVRVRTCEPVLRPGALIGFGSSPSSFGTLRARWTLRVIAVTR